MTRKKNPSASKRELLGTMIAALLEDFSEEEKKKILRYPTRNKSQNSETIEMVEQ